MLKKKEKIDSIFELFSIWSYQIEITNNSGYFDVNKFSEGLCQQLLNLIYDLKLENLNHKRSNFPSIDLADEVNKIAYQITSRTDGDKIRKNLKTFFEEEYDKQYPEGLHFLILNRSETNIKFGKNHPSKHYRFNEKKHLKTFKNLINDIEQIYDIDYPKFQKIESLLMREISLTNKSEEISLDDIPELYFSFEIDSFIKYNQEELSIFLQDIARRQEQNCIPLFNVSILEEEPFQNEIDNLKKNEEDINNRRKISDLKDIILQFSKIKKEIAFKTETLLFLKKNEGYSYLTFEITSQSLYNMFNNLWEVQMLRENTIIEDLLVLKLKPRIHYKSKNEIKLDLMNNEGLTFCIYEPLTKIKEIYPKEFDLNNRDMIMMSTFWSIEVSMLGLETIILKVFPAFIEKMYHENMKIEDIRNICINDFIVGIG